ncbi:hypothetical protein [Agaribacterium sp. ZY112]|uniref:hypothetical protein n=1 Tax=Agaribacterium sp. ZY112 TaxID=3233574 RepID=UPI003525CD51
MNKLVAGLLLMLAVDAFAQAAELRDPTRPLNYRPAKIQSVNLELQAVFIRTSGNSAIINGRSLELGQRISGWTLTNIKRNSVQLRSQGKVKNLTLRKQLLATTKADS